MFYRPPALGDVDTSYDVIAYRGAIVASRAGWVADAKRRGGVITQVPGGFWHDIEAARFGAAAPYTYELPPFWLLVWDGVDVASDEFLALAHYQDLINWDANQLQGIADVIDAGKSAYRYLPWAIGAVVALGIFNALPRGR